jgi:hypothetical protein
LNETAQATELAVLTDGIKKAFNPLMNMEEMRCKGRASPRSAQLKGNHVGEPCRQS